MLIYNYKVIILSLIAGVHASELVVSYDIVVDIAPELKWVPEDGYKNLKIVVEIDREIDAQTAAEQELRRRHKALGSLKIVIDRGLQVNTK